MNCQECIELHKVLNLINQARVKIKGIDTIAITPIELDKAASIIDGLLRGYNLGEKPNANQN